MNTNKKWNILFIKDDKSMLDTDTKMFIELFNKADMVSGEQKALKLIYSNKYDIVVYDISVDPLEGTTFIKQIKEMKPEQVIVALVLDSDEEKIGGLIDSGINTFLLNPTQLDQALEAIAQMNPYQKEDK